MLQDYNAKVKEWDPKNKALQAIQEKQKTLNQLAEDDESVR